MHEKPLTRFPAQSKGSICVVARKKRLGYSNKETISSLVKYSGLNNVVFIIVVLIEDSEVNGPGQWDGSAPMIMQEPGFLPWLLHHLLGYLDLHGHRHTCALAWGKSEEKRWISHAQCVKADPGTGAHPFHPHSSGVNIAGVVWSILSCRRGWETPPLSEK